MVLMENWGINRFLQIHSHYKTRDCQIRSQLQKDLKFFGLLNFFVLIEAIIVDIIVWYLFVKKKHLGLLLGPFSFLVGSAYLYEC